MQTQVQTHPLFFCGDSDTDHDINELQENVSNNRCVDESGDNAFCLNPYLFKNRLHRRARNRLGSKHTGQDGTHNTADAVHAEGIQRVIVTQPMLESSGSEVADKSAA